MYPKPIKNWKDKSEYTKHEDATNWAWEFLRRNPEYQEDVGRYERGMEGFEGIYKIVEDGGLFVEVLDSGVSEYTSLEYVLAKKYGIDGFSFPSWKNDNPLLIRESSGVFMAPVSYKVKNKDEVLLVFDLTSPLELQLMKAKRMLEGLSEVRGVTQKPNKSRDHFQKFCNYIRVLDAVAENADFDEVAKIMVPHVDNDYVSGFLGRKDIKNWVKAANEYRDNKYRQLMYKGEKEYFAKSK